MHNLGVLAYLDDDGLSAVRWLESAAERERALGDTAVLGNTLGNLARVRGLLGDYEAARSLGEESVEIARTRGDRVEVLNMEASLGGSLAEAGDPEGRRLLERSARELESLDRRGYATCLGDLLDTVVADNDMEAANLLAPRVEAAAKEVGLDVLLGGVALARGHMAQQGGAAAKANRWDRDAVAILLDCDQPMTLVRALERVACVAADEARFDEAAALMGAAEAERAARARPIPKRDQAHYLQAQARVADALGADLPDALTRGAAAGFEALARSFVTDRPGE